MSDPHAVHADEPARPPPGTSPFGPRSPFAEYYLPPRLGIIHLLAWTAATAVLLKFWMGMEMLREAGDIAARPATEMVRQVVSVIYSMAHAAGIVGTGILLLAKVRGRTGRLQPGHWLLPLDTAAALLAMSCWGLWVAAEAVGAVDEFSSPWFLGAYGLVGILCGGMYGWAALAAKEAKRWKALFAALALVCLMRGLSYVAVWVLDMYELLTTFPVGSLIVGPVLLLTLLVDQRRGPRRDWLHWLGVAIVASNILMSVAWWLWWTLARPMDV